ncbi:MAG: PKD domain-containing protein, partial [Gemmatimonadota bacterium]
MREAKLSLTGPKMEERKLTLPVDNGWIRGQVDDVPVGPVTVDLTLLDDNGDPLWSGATQVEVKKGQTADATITLGRAGDSAPQVTMLVDRESGQPGTEFVFKAEVTDRHDAEETIQVRWDLNGDGNYEKDWSTDKEIRHQYPDPGKYTVVLQARDRSEKESTTTHQVDVIYFAAQVGDQPGQDSLRASVADGVVQISGHASVEGSVVYHWSQVLDYPGAKNVSVMGTLSDNNSTSASRVLFRPELGPGLYVLTLRIEDPDRGLTSATDTLFVLVGSSPPVAAVAGSPWDTEVGQTVVLQGQGSDPDGDEIQYRWRGERLDLLSDTTSATPTFTAREAGQFTYHLVTIDGDPQESEPAEAVVQVGQPEPMAAFRAEPTSGKAPLTVAITNESENGTSYFWDFGDGATSGSQSPGPHVYGQTGQYTIVLRVSGGGQESTAQVTIVVADVSRPDVVVENLVLTGPSNAPMAAGVNEGDRVGCSVQLFNGGSQAADQVGLKVWMDGAALSGPLPGPVRLAPQQRLTLQVQAQWTATSGQHQLRVEAVVQGAGVEDANPANNQRDLDFRVNGTPVANAGNDRTTAVGRTVSLDGTGSGDPDGDVLSYAWTQVSGPGVAINGANTATPSVTPQAAGEYVFALVVKDGHATSKPDQVTVMVSETAAALLFADPNLEGAVRDAIGKPTGDLTAKDVAALVDLKANNRGIQRLDGIEALTALVQLQLQGNQMTGLGPVSSLTGLKGLNVGGNPSLANIGAVAALGKLEFLMMDDCAVEDISALGGLRGLRNLQARFNRIADLMPLRNLPNLEYVALSGNKVTDLTPLVENAGLGAGEFLDVTGNPLSAVALSSQVPSLQARGVEVAFDAAVEPVTREMTVDLPGGATMQFVWIEPGTFVMGSAAAEPGRSGDEGPQHQVTITRGFWLGKYEVTQGQWYAAMGTSPWSGASGGQADSRYPASAISWDMAQDLVHQLNAHEGATAYRLPTEAEWEYACRAGTTTPWSFGGDEAQLPEYAWYADNALNVGLQNAQPVGMKRPNAWGLFDMHGNLWEGVQDRYGPYTSAAQA